MESSTQSPLRQLRTDFSGLRVACLDSHSSTTQALSHLLQKIFKCEVGVANDGVSGIELVRAMKPDVVFCSIGLSERSGYEVAKAIRSSMPHKPLLVAHTGYSRREVGEQAKDAGFNYLVMKPVTLEVIAQILSCVDGSLTDLELSL